MIDQTAASGATAAAQGSATMAVLAGGLASGAIDILYAIGANFLRHGLAPERTLQSVASGLLGRGAYQGGAATAMLGLLLHMAMTVAMAAIFLAAVRALPPLRQHLLAGGLVYGILIYFAMRWVVVPLSRFPGDLRSVDAIELAVHAVGVGLVIALAVRRFAPMA